MIRENIAQIRRRLSGACARAGRDPGSITIVAISKGRAGGEIGQAIDCGITDIGENRVQEAIVKYNGLVTGKPAGHKAVVWPPMAKATNRLTIKWHMVGHLQTNKVKEAVKIFDLIHSVDSPHLAQEIDKQAAKLNKVQDILIEVKTSGEAAKFGVKPGDAAGVIKEISGLKNISIKGLMTIAPAVNSPEEARPYFSMLRQLRDKICHLPFATSHLPILSMGMSDDFEAAVEEGSNMLRLGRVIFDPSIR